MIIFIFSSSIFLNILFLCITAKDEPNLIIVLADDLGYGDLGWGPFRSHAMKYIETPCLKKMAESGLTMTNFHVAAPICSPSRAAIMVGLFPWRFGVDFIYAGDKKLDHTIETDNEQLPLIPNVAMSLSQGGYYCAHIGKWHLGGQSHIDIPNRYQNRNCTVPGINQYGFHEYVGMSEGTGSARYNTHQTMNTYHEGSKYLFKNDAPLPPPTGREILTDRQTDEAMRVIREQVAKKQKFFLNLWYDAPHSPWEVIEQFAKKYENVYTERDFKYATMISNMDYSIGRLLDLLDSLKIAEDTLVVFTSDNGPEQGAGSPGSRLKGRKRLLTEGGIRVPAIWQWKGRIPAGVTTDKFAVATDLYPTFVDAAGLKMPGHVRIDGISLLPMLLRPNSVRKHGDERTVLWYSHCPGYPRVTAAWSHGFKLLWNDYEGRTGSGLPPSWRLFDMRVPSSEPLEERNLLESDIFRAICSKRDSSSNTTINWSDVADIDRSQLSTEQTLKVLTSLTKYLQLKLFWFRYDGDFDWRTNYYVNKPYQSYEASCHTRDLSLSTLPMSVPPLFPEFCGKDVFELVANRRICLCSLDNCTAMWDSPPNQGWSLGSLRQDLSHFHNEGDLSNLVRHLHSTLRFGSFSPLCALGTDIRSIVDEATLLNHYNKYKTNSLRADYPSSIGLSLATQMSHDSSVMRAGSGRSQKRTSQGLSTPLSSFTWLTDARERPAIAHNGKQDSNKQNLITISHNSLSRISIPSELVTRWEGVKTMGRSCFPDVPLLVCSSGPIPPIPLCAISYARMKDDGATSKGYFDEGVVLFAMREVLISLKVPKAGGPKRSSTNNIMLLDPAYLPKHVLFDHDDARPSTGEENKLKPTEMLRSISKQLSPSTVEVKPSNNYNMRSIQTTRTDAVILPIPVYIDQQHPSPTIINTERRLHWILGILICDNDRDMKLLVINTIPTSSFNSSVNMEYLTQQKMKGIFCWLIGITPRKKDFHFCSQLEKNSKIISLKTLPAIHPSDPGGYVVKLVENLKIFLLSKDKEAKIKINHFLNQRSFTEEEVDQMRRSFSESFWKRVLDEENKRKKLIQWLSSKKFRQ